VSVRNRARPTITTLFFGLLAILISIVLAILGLALVRHLVPLTFFESRSQATDTIHQAIAMVYGVAVGFAILLVWQQLDTAEATTQREASNLESLYRLAEQLPESDRNQVQELTRSYAQIVVEEEWPLLADGQASSHAQNTVDELRASIQKFEPQTLAELALYTQMLTNIDELYGNRELRLLESQEGVPPLVWMVLVFTGMITVAFTYLFGTEKPLIHMLRVIALTIVVALSLYTVHFIEHPFVGDVQVGPDAFKMVLDRIYSG
jgi:hypothetical protein